MQALYQSMNRSAGFGYTDLGCDMNFYILGLLTRTCSSASEDEMKYIKVLYLWKSEDKELLGKEEV